MDWKITIHDGDLSFSAGHLIVQQDNYEALHGHNYGLSVELQGTDLNQDSYVLNFGIVKTLLRSLVKEMHHHVLVPLRNPYMQVRLVQGEWILQLAENIRYVLPEASVIPIDTDNVTAERLAEYIAKRLQAEFQQHDIAHLTTLTVGIAETAMQNAYCTIRL